jgi:nuclease EXOG
MYDVDDILCCQIRRTAVRSVFHFVKDIAVGKARRQYSVFKPDPSILPPFSASNEDYLGSGWTRGHMAPAGNYKYDQASFWRHLIVIPDFFSNLV